MLSDKGSRGPLAELFASGGVITQRQANTFALRLRVTAGSLTAVQLAAVAKAAARYGSGTVHLTVRQGIEIQGVSTEQIVEAVAELSMVGLQLGACGPRVRVVTACPGSSTCPNGLGNSQELAKRLDDRYFGQGDLPHKVKISVSGCPNGCTKPQENDIGLMGIAEPALVEAEATECIGCGLCSRKCPGRAITMVQGKPEIDHTKCLHDANCINSCPTGAISGVRGGWQVFVGGNCGKHPRVGTPLAAFLNDADAEDLVGRIIGAYRTLGRKGERLGAVIDRVGLSEFRVAVAEGTPFLGAEVG